jgi:transposase
LASPSGPPADLPRHRAQPGKLTPYEDYLRRRLQEYPELSARKLLLELRRQGYAGGYTLLKEFLRGVRDRTPKAFLRIETLPGEFAQVDWANVGSIQIGNARRKLSCFVMVLSYSRMMYLEFTLSQCLEDFLACHVNAFRFFGGIPKKINYDNLKTVVLSRVGAEIRFHPRFLDFAGYCLFEPVPCAVRAAWQKGKVESGIKYVRSAFLAGRSLLNLPELRAEGARWLAEEANARIHGTTRERPLDRFAAEKPLLSALPPTDYDCAIVRSVQATEQALVQFETNRYTVPSAKARRTLTLKATGQTVMVYDGPTLIATHARCYEKYRVIENPAHYAGLLAQRKKARQAKRVEAFLALGPECEAYLKGLVAAELHLSSHLDKILELARLYGREELLGAVRHALKYNAFGAAYVQNIVLQRQAARNRPRIEPLRLAKRPDWAEVSVEETDLGLYDQLFDPPQPGAQGPRREAP